MGPTALSPSEGRRAEDFFALKNPTALAGFEPANLGTKGQHATSRPSKPLESTLTKVVPPQTGLSHCFVTILIPICSVAKFMVVLSPVFVLYETFARGGTA
jgi:hypothetical protein